MEPQELGYEFTQYLGDSVYVGFDGYHLWLMTWNGYPDDPRNRIALEPSVLQALFRYHIALKEKLKETPNGDD